MADPSTLNWDTFSQMIRYSTNVMSATPGGLAAYKDAILTILDEKDMFLNVILMLAAQAHGAADAGHPKGLGYTTQIVGVLPSGLPGTESFGRTTQVPTPAVYAVDNVQYALSEIIIHEYTHLVLIACFKHDGNPYPDTPTNLTYQAVQTYTDTRPDTQKKPWDDFMSRYADPQYTVLRYKMTSFLKDWAGYSASAMPLEMVPYAVNMVLLFRNFSIDWTKINNPTQDIPFVSFTKYFENIIFPILIPLVIQSSPWPY